MRSLQTKIISLTICCTLLAASITLGVSYWNAKNVLHKDSNQILNLLCSNTARELNETLHSAEQSVNTIHNFAIERLSRTDSSLFTNKEEFTAHVDEMREIALNVAKHTPGVIAFYYRFSSDLKTPSDSFFMTRPEGRQGLSDTPFIDLDMSSPGDTEYLLQYDNPAETLFSAPVWFNPYYKTSLSTWVISYMAPVLLGDTVIGTIGMDISAGILQEIAGSVSVYDTGYPVLLDNDNNIVYHPDYPTGLQRAGYLGELKELMDLLIDSIQHPDVARYIWKGKEYLVASLFLDNGMPFAIVAPADEVTMSIQTLLTHLLLASNLLILALLPPLIYRIIRRIITPLRQLTDASQKIARGDLDVTIDYISNDEVGLLAESFRQTASALKERIDYINGLAYTDSLTGIGNKTAYNETVLDMDNHIKEGDASFAVVLMDLNDLKKMNDTFGHEAGDMLLTDASHIMKKTFGPEALYRIGGDEFVAVLTDGAVERREELMEHFRDEIARFNRSPDKRYKQELQIARGTAPYDSSQDKSFADVFRRADDLMYKNKQEQKGLGTG